MPVGPEPAEATAVGENPEPPAALDGATRLLLVRHAVTPFTEAGRVDGRGGADPDLSDTGRQQARQARRNAVRDLVEGRSASSRRPSPEPDRPEPPWRRPSASTR